MLSVITSRDKVSPGRQTKLSRKDISLLRALNYRANRVAELKASNQS